MIGHIRRVFIIMRFVLDSRLHVPSGSLWGSQNNSHRTNDVYFVLLLFITRPGKGTVCSSVH
jgi:hypothetical protein